MSESTLPRELQASGTTIVADIATTDNTRPRKARKKKNKSQTATPTNEPSGSTSSTSNGLGTFEEGTDFVAFAMSDIEVVEAEDRDTPVREWGKSERPHEESHGKKRKSDEMERDDRRVERRRRLDYTPRKAPWVADVDWRSCKNVPEL